MPEKNRQWVLRARPKGLVGRECFELTEEPVPGIEEGQLLVRNLWLSCDPTQRGWLERDTYMPAIGLGEVIRSLAAGQVVESRHPAFQRGDFVSGMFGWQDYAVVEGRGAAAPHKLPPGIELPTALSLFGLTGFTAYFGLLDVGRPKSGETVLVSAAAGSTGSFVVQIAKIKGARVVGIAGGAEKCRWLLNDLGADAAIDYKAEDVGARIGELCPGGIDVYFDNVGGEILDAALAHLAHGARVVMCGAISGYNDFEHMHPIRNYMNLTLRRATMQGFLVLDYLPRASEAVSDLAAWSAAGKIKSRVDVVEGLENAPDALRRLFTGANIGKQLVKIADAPLAGEAPR